MFPFTVTHQNILYLSLRFTVENTYNILENICEEDLESIWTLHCLHLCSFTVFFFPAYLGTLPPHDQWNSVEPLAGTCWSLNDPVYFHSVTLALWTLQYQNQITQFRSHICSPCSQLCVKQVRKCQLSFHSPAPLLAQDIVRLMLCSLILALGVWFVHLGWSYLKQKCALFLKTQARVETTITFHTIGRVLIIWLYLRLADMAADRTVAVHLTWSWETTWSMPAMKPDEVSHEAH